MCHFNGNSLPPRAPLECWSQIASIKMLSGLSITYYVVRSISQAHTTTRHSHVICLLGVELAPCFVTLEVVDLSFQRIHRSRHISPDFSWIVSDLFPA
jgi:hypothetical protein